MAALPAPPPSQPPHWPAWQANMQAMAATRHPSTFWEWPAVRHTMTVDHFPIGDQLHYLQTDWPRWEWALSNLGDERHYRNMVVQAYALKTWEDYSGLKIEQMESVYEFGGGYGAMAQLCRRMNFTGSYRIQDLKEFELLQRYFLGQQGVEVEHVAAPVHADLMIGLYSVSETPDPLRQSLADTLTADSYLLLTSEKWGTAGSVDNRAYFEQFVAQRNHLTWAFPRYLSRPDFFALAW